MKLSGPTKNFKEAWERLGKKLKLAVPKGDTTNVSNYLGCEHTRGEVIIEGKKIQTMQWDVTHSIKRTLAVY